MKKILLLSVTLLLSGCISSSQVNERISAWDNVALNDLINAWGVPTKTQVIAQRKFHVWNSKADANSPAFGISVGSHGRHSGISISSLFGGDNQENVCSRVVEVDGADNILSITWTGDKTLCYELTPEKIEAIE